MAFTDSLPDISVTATRSDFFGNLALPDVTRGWGANPLPWCIISGATCGRWGITHKNCLSAYLLVPAEKSILLENSNKVARMVLAYRQFLSLAHLSRWQMGLFGVMSTNVIIGGAAAVGSGTWDATYAPSDYSVSCVTKTGEEFVDPTAFPNDDNYGIAVFGNVKSAGRPIIVRAVSWTAPFTPGDLFTVNFWTPTGKLDQTKIVEENPVTVTLYWWNSGARPIRHGLAEQVQGGAAAGNPLLALMELLRGGPRFILRQTNRSVPLDIEDYDTYTGTAGGLGLDTLVDDGFDAAGSPTTVETDIIIGGWGYPTTYADPTTGKTLVKLRRGLEVCRENDDGTAMAFLTPESWPPNGPGAGHQLAATNGADAALSTTNDPQGRLAAMVCHGGSGWRNLDNPAAKGSTLGCGVRFRRASVFIQRPNGGSTLQTREYGTLEMSPRTVGGVEYAGLFSIKRPMSHVASGAFPVGSLVKSVTPVAIVDMEDGSVLILLAHGIDTLGYYDEGLGEEKTVQFCHGGLHVAQHQRFRVTNYKSLCAFGGDGNNTLIEPGHVLVLDGATIPTELKGCQLLITASTAYDQTVSTPSFWRPNPPEGWTTEDDDAWYTTNISGRTGLPADFVNWGKAHATIRVTDENAAIMTLIGTSNIIGQTFAVNRHACIARPGYIAFGHGTTETGTNDTEVASGYLWFAAWGRLYLPADYGTDCLRADMDLADHGNMVSVGNVLNPMIDALQGCLTGMSFDITPSAQSADQRIHVFTIVHSPDDTDFEVVPPDWYSGQFIWTDGKTRYVYSITTGATTNKAQSVINWENPWFDVTITYSNMLIPFWSLVLWACKWRSDCVDGGYLHLNAVELTATKVTYTRAWNEEHTAVGTTVATESLTAFDGTVSLIGVYDDGAGNPMYDTLAWSEATLSTLEDENEVAVDATTWIKAILDNSREYSYFSIFLGLNDYSHLITTPTDGYQFMEGLSKGLYEWNMTYDPVTKEWTGTASAITIQFSGLTISNGIVKWNPATMDLSTGEA